jgi:hypothetical protein
MASKCFNGLPRFVARFNFSCNLTEDHSQPETIQVKVAELFKVIDVRSALQDDGTMKQVRWETPVSDYREFEGRKISTYGKTIWNYPEGDFTYGVFTLKSIRYNIAE